MDDEKMLCPGCGEDSLVWFSGQAGAVISLNGSTAAYCSEATCGTELWEGEDDGE